MIRVVHFIRCYYFYGVRGLIDRILCFGTLYVIRSPVFESTLPRMQREGLTLAVLIKGSTYMYSEGRALP